VGQAGTQTGGTVGTSVRDRVIEIVCEQMGQSKEKVNEGTSFINDLGADSLDTVELVMELEDEFDLSIPDEEAEKIKTVGDAIQYIETHGQKKE
jgi:acyl carrier protein